ncbi:MAG TPA: helix-turn-helix domain-containing protein [Candidatus Cybelea sp.]|nr:helix-turn-helix domain-containing protein [Candidatus Cybelea sp.]
MPDIMHPRSRTPVVCLLTTPETSPSVLFGLFDVLSSAGSVYPEMLEGKTGNLMFDVKIVAATKAPFRCFGNILLEPAAGIDEIDFAEVVIVCDMFQPIDASPRGRYPNEVGWLKRMHRAGALLGSVCTGSLVLAEAGLLDGLESATHWAYHKVFRDHYPKVKLREDSILCLSAEDERIVTAGGTTSWQELSLHLIRRFGGPRQAILTTKVFLLGDRSDGQLPFALMLPSAPVSDAAIADAQEWISANYACINPVARMAAMSGLTPRTFARRFRAATGIDPIDYVQSLRVEEARQMLDADGLGIDEIGRAVGYEDATSFRRLFKRRMGLTPAAYRRKFVHALPRSTPVATPGEGHRAPKSQAQAR